MPANEGSVHISGHARRDSMIISSTDNTKKGHQRSNTTVATKNELLWTQALDEWRSILGDKDSRAIKSTRTFDALKKSIQSNNKVYKDRTIPKLLETLNPFFDRLHSFTRVFDTFAQVHDIACIIWGSLKLLIELASRFKDTLQSIVTMLNDIEKHMPRFETYLNLFPESDRIEQAASLLYHEVVGFCIQCIRFLRKNPIRNLIRVAWSSFEAVFEESLKKIKKCRSDMDLEAFTGHLEASVSRHQELKSLLNTRGAMETPQTLHLPCHSILFPRNPNFFGRNDSLKHLEDRLIHSGATQQHSVAVVGLGGVGKTQLATEFVWAHSDRFQAVLWVQADSTHKLEQGYIMFAQKLGLIPSDSTVADTSRIIEKVNKWLEDTDASWLVVFDNVDDDGILKTCWPINSKGSILLTARNTSISFTPANETYHLQPFSGEEGSKLLQDLLPNPEVSSTIQLSVALGGLPLAITQIAGYIATVRCTVAEFTEIYKEHSSGDGILSHRGAIDFNYEHTLATVWEMTLSRIDEQCSFFLEVVAFLDADSIPEALFYEGRPALSNKHAMLFPSSKANYFGILGKLCTYDLVERDPGRASLRIHRLVQQAIRQRMSAQKWLQMFEVVLDLLSYLYPRQSFGMAMDNSWGPCDLYLSQILTLASHCDILLSDDPTWVDTASSMLANDGKKFSQQLAELLHNATWFMQEKGMFERLLPIVETGKKVLERWGGEDSMLMGELYNTLGNVHLEVGNSAESKDNFLKVKAIREKYCAPDDPNMVNIMQNLSLAETALGNYDTAIRISRDVVSTRERLPDSEFAAYKTNTLPTNYSNLCRILCFAGRIDEAAELGLKAVDMSKQTFGLRSRNTSQAIFNLADIRLKQSGKDALKLHYEALILRKDTLGDHYQTAGSCYKVACLLLENGDTTHSRRLLEDSITMNQSAYSAQGALARSYFKLSQILSMEHEVEEAEKTLRLAMNLRQELTSSPVDFQNPSASFDTLVPYMDR